MYDCSYSDILRLIEIIKERNTLSTRRVSTANKLHRLKKIEGNLKERRANNNKPVKHPWDEGKSVSIPKKYLNMSAMDFRILMYEAKKANTENGLATSLFTRRTHGELVVILRKFKIRLNRDTMANKIRGIFWDKNYLNLQALDKIGLEIKTDIEFEDQILGRYEEC